MKNVDEILRDAADLYESKNKEYGNAYMDHPKIMKLLFGEITLRTEQDYAMYTRVSAIVAKLNRYAKNFPHGHADSARDATVFAGMLEELNQTLESK